MAKKINYADLYTLRKDGRYQGYYKDADGVRHALCDKDPQKLCERIQEREKPKEVTFKDIAEMWEREHREEIVERTWTNYEPHYKDIVNRHGDKAIEDVQALDINQDLMQSKAKGLSATVVNTRRSIYKMIFDYAIVHGYTQFNPVLAVKLPKGLKRGKRQAPSDDIIKIILSNIDKPFGFFPFFLLCTGLRKSEALALTWQDVDFKAKEISITKSIDNMWGSNPQIKAPKSTAGIRSVPIIAILEQPLKDHKKRCGNSPLLFPAPASNRGGAGGGLMTERGYEGAWLRYCQATNLIDDDGKPLVTAHHLRHGTATLMFEGGVDELTAQHVLGHSRVEITREVYTDLREDKRRQSILLLNTRMAELMAKTPNTLQTKDN